VKVTVGDLLAIREDLQTVFDKELPIKTSWSLSKIIKKIEDHYGIFETNRLKVLKNYVKEGETKVPEDKFEEFSTKIKELLDIEVDLECDPINIGDLGDVSISPMTLSKMAFLFSD
jgi:hypothetical protein